MAYINEAMDNYPDGIQQLREESEGSMLSNPCVDRLKIPDEDYSIRRSNSYYSFSLSFGENSTRSKKESQLLSGPRKLLRLCLFVMVLPLVLILLALYVRQNLSAPQHYSLAPSDQRIINEKFSSIWCQSQEVNMNGSFNAFLLKDNPKRSKSKPRYVILKHLELQDDVKEYWGFYLNKGTTVTLNTCTRYEGGQLMILKGAENLHKCAWIGEKDSLEEFQEMRRKNPAMESQEIKFRISNGEDSDEREDELIRRFKIGSQILPENMTVEIDSTVRNFTSVERRNSLDILIRKALRLTKHDAELNEIISKHQERRKNDTEQEKLDIMKNLESGEDREEFRGDRSKREVTHQKLNSEFDEETKMGDVDTEMKQNNRDAEQIIGGLNIPKTLKYERGFINQSSGFDFSAEEHRSSYSSSEEALASCEGVLLALPLQPTTSCSGFHGMGANRISYDIAEDATYYFVFSSDNEIVTNNLFFNMTLDKVVYDTAHSVANCTGSFNCSLKTSFWSDDRTVIEVPVDDFRGAEVWDEYYILDSVCKPRVSVYLVLLLLVPLLILFCAFH